MVCLRNGEEAPEENRQRELADELRAQVKVIFDFLVLLSFMTCVFSYLSTEFGMCRLLMSFLRDEKILNGNFSYLFPFDQIISYCVIFHKVY